MGAPAELNIVEASIGDLQRALDRGLLTSVELVTRYLIRIGTYDVQAGLNAFTVINPRVLEEAQASDDRRAAGLPNRRLEGIPYTLKDSFAYAGLTVTNGSPAFEGLQSGADSFVASQLRAAGAVLLGKTNMPPMAAGGMQRGLYGRAESPYNRDYLTAAFSSGSSNGAATSTAASLAAFGVGSETVSSGRSPASNNALIAYTPSRGVISCRGLWPLYVTCDVPVPYARSVEDMLLIRDVLAVPDPISGGDFWRDQPHVVLPPLPSHSELQASHQASLRGKRIAVPRMYVGLAEHGTKAKVPYTNPSVLKLWEEARKDLEELGATVIYTDFPLVINYEDDTVSHEANNVKDAPDGWNKVERGLLVAKAWDDFLRSNADSRLSDMSKVNAQMIFPKPDHYVPDKFVELKNLIPFNELPALAQRNKRNSIYDLPGMERALNALERQRKRDFEDWMNQNNYDLVAFPAVGDVGKADLEFDVDSAEHALRNGVRYSHGNRAIRHLGVPTVNIPMGSLSGTGMPVNLTFAGKAYTDTELLQYGYAYEQKSHKRMVPPLTPPLPTDTVSQVIHDAESTHTRTRPILTASVVSQGGLQEWPAVHGKLLGGHGPYTINVFVNGAPISPVPVKDGQWEVSIGNIPAKKKTLSWNLQPMENPKAMVVVTAIQGTTFCACKLLWMP